MKTTVDDSVYAGITFEFFNVITKEDGNVDFTYWNEIKQGNYKYSESVLHNFLNVGENSVFNKLPDDLKADGVIEEVYKPVAEKEPGDSDFEINTSYTTKLFPLSYYEMYYYPPDFVMEEGSLYDYWDIHRYPEHRIKSPVGKSDDIISYWLRTPVTDTGGATDAYYIENDSNVSLKSIYVNHSDISVAPAFCV